MRKILFTLVTFSLIAAAYTACQRASEENKVDSELIGIQGDSVKVLYKYKLDSADFAWDVYAKEELEKITDLERLLQEISYTQGYNKFTYDSLSKRLAEVKAMQLEAGSMTSDKIDAYDNAINEIKGAIIKFAVEHPDFEKVPFMGKLVDSVEARDGRILLYRIKYDNYARDFNNFLTPARQYPGYIDTTALNTRPLFQLED